jgi:hypothetical protein
MFRFLKTPYNLVSANAVYKELRNNAFICYTIDTNYWLMKTK